MRRFIKQWAVVLASSFFVGTCLVPSALSFAQSRAIHHKNKKKKKAPNQKATTQKAPARKTTWTNGWAVDGADIKKAPCVRDRFFTEEEMTSWLNQWAQKGSGRISSAKVEGIRFENEYPELIQVFKDLMTPAIADPNAARKPMWIDPDCSQVLCAAEQVFGKKIGVQLLYLLARYGVNGSPIATPSASPWRAEELDEVLLAHAAYPDFLSKKNYGSPFIHRARDVDSGNHVGYAGGVYSAWNRLSAQERYISIAHERAHRFSKDSQSGNPFSTLDMSLEWYELSGWTSDDSRLGLVDFGPFHLAHPEWAPSLYGRTNPTEDFAESIMKYRFDAQAFLQALGPQGRPKYDFIRDRIFEGVEFLSESTCRRAFDHDPPQVDMVFPDPFVIPSLNYIAPFPIKPRNSSSGQDASSAH